MSNSDTVATNILINEITHVDIVRDKARKANVHKAYYENNKDKVRKQQREAYFIKKEIKSLMLMLL
jgi:hypothetical protein